MEKEYFSAITLMLAALTFLIFSYLRYSKQKKSLAVVESEFSPVDSLRRDCRRLNSEFADLQSKYRIGRRELKEFEKVIDTYHVGVGTMDVSTYKPLYDTRNLSELEQRLSEAVKGGKDLVKADSACRCHLGDDLRLNGKKGAAKTFINREIRLRIRCLDNEVKAAIAIVDWNNIGRLVERIHRKFTEINTDSKLVKIFLTEQYLAAKLLELRLSFEVQKLKADLKEEEREMRQRIREEQRDEERLKSEVAKVELQRQRMEILVEQELSKIDEATVVQRDRLALHQRELEILREKERRALSMAQQTRSGFVYIITNEASFGSGICKIGMTRRLDPNDRVKELGDASVPELFTVHHFIYTDDAPTLEKFFHDQLSEKRINQVNRRKEFFRVSPESALNLLDNYSGNFSLEEVEI
ncbi:DUF4041 domain-containing protein [Gilvimarinus sp. 1_MG-2023]|uniref:DUF4041 domain-containing protein n=1 Tax=Gilvimarinus sp. 1_MG-2023 TaxID=3062638 RepID=UPI0026E39CB3|nr:DUF4041 domain-containing protein [Gilvimarinus sp. 1_MG-2023]MDO6746176.1 DUF4041 domain-containing protein [Gilvimarinus sp. 1_MG-2023]